MARVRKQGIVKDDRRNHAVVVTMTGRKALCGAGRIHLPLGTPFDSTSPAACPDCAKRVEADGLE
jgi:hypothetical protein